MDGLDCGRGGGGSTVDEADEVTEERDTKDGVEAKDAAVELVAVAPAPGGAGSPGMSRSEF